MDFQHPSTHSSEQVAVPPMIAPGQPDTSDMLASSERPWWRTTWATGVALLLILLLGLYFRALNLTRWDSGTGQHPDERFFTDVASLVRVPASVSEYFDSARSPGNPRNIGRTFFVYGHFPIAFTRLVAVTLTPNAALPPTVPAMGVPPDPQTGVVPQVPNPELRVPKLIPLQAIFNPQGKNLTGYYEIVRVGRALVVLFDLGSILLIYLIGRRLFDRRVGLLAALFATLAVMPIQQSHFFVDPIFSTFFAVLTLYWAVRVAQGGGPGNCVAMGISIGLAMANRITLGTLGLVAIVAAVQAALAWRAGIADHAADAPSGGRADMQNGPGSATFTERFLRYNLPLLCMAGLITLLTFRIFQPDAFIGSAATSPPIAGYPPASPEFMQGWSFFDVRPDPRYVENLQTVQRLVTGQDDFPPSQQWVQRPAYLFPWKNMVLWGMGPALGITAWLGFIYFGLRILDFSYRKRTAYIQNPQSKFQNAAVVLWVWVGFYFAWQGGQFASTMRYMLPIYGALIIFGAWLLITLWDWGRRQAAGRRDAVNSVRWSAVGSRWLLVVVILCTFAWAYAFTRIYTRPHSRVMAARWVLEHVPPGAKITSEQWDDALPLAVDGGDPWGTTYRGIDTAPYAEDDPQKYTGYFNTDNNAFVPGLLDQLEQADYITLTSNRVYGSATRLPMRYPALTRYYHYLFTGELGFELVADITSYPTLFGIPIPDQGAEEAFTVYDHPRVLIFRKTTAFSRARAEQLIPSDINWNEVYKLPVRLADHTTTALRLTESQWPHYRAAGTWSEHFNRQGLVNQLAPLVWLLTLEIIGLAAFALLFRLLPWLPDRGFALARALGLLLIAYAAWLLGSLRLMPFTPLSVWLCALPLLSGGAWVAWRARADLRSFWGERRTALLTAEGIYLAAFALLLIVRWLNPDLWHPARGGEKPMDFAYLNAVLKSAAFPPYDPWFAGGYINYYYFGFVIVGTLIHLTTIVPDIAYNLAVPSLFALTALGAWGVVYNLLSPHRTDTVKARPSAGVTLLVDSSTASPPHPRMLAKRQPSPERTAQVSAALAAIFVLLLGNLAQPIWFLTGYAQDMQGRPEWAFWDATRIVEGTINEFPFFTFLFADLHAHMIVMPFSLAMVGLTVALARFPVSSSRFSIHFQPARRAPFILNPRAALILLLLGLLAGTLRATNTWDYPTYVGLTTATLGLITWRHFTQQNRRYQHQHTQPDWWAFFGHIASLILAITGVVLIGNLLFLPFTRNFVTESSGVELLREGLRATLLEQVLFAQRTSLWDYLRLYGLWLFLLISAGLLLAARCFHLRPWQVAGLGAAVLLLVLAGATLGASALLLLVPLLLGAITLAWRLRYLPPRMLLPLLWAGTALALSLMVEMLVVRGDVGRMNTVFKFGLHTWTLFALASAIALPWTWKQFGRWNPSASRIGWAWRGAAIVLVAAGLVYPLTATPARIADRYAQDLPTTLDGMAFMRSVQGSEAGTQFPLSEDAEGIAWLRQNITGTPIMLEAHLPSYQWAGRIATFTGLPTLLGWEWHQIQQRNAVNATPIINHRKAVIDQIYSSPDISQALQSIRSYGIEYIYVGGVERAIYNPAGLAKFETLAQQGQLQLVFTSGNTAIYRVMQPGQPTMLTTDLPVIPPTLETPPPLMLDRPVNELPAVGGYAWNTWASTNSATTVLVWLAALYALALLGLPLAMLAFGRWRDGGVVWARLIGLLLLGYAIWMPTSLEIWQYDAWGLFGGLLLVLALNVGLIAWLGQRPTNPSGDPRDQPLLHGLRTIGAHLWARRGDILIGEGLFLTSFGLFVLLRALNPDLWHPVWGGEKPMEFGFLNALLRSPVMPPFDPFFSGGYINYYYYGLYLVSLPIKLTGIAPAIAFNLIIPMLFALTLTGSYAIVAQLSGRKRYGLVGAAFVALLGNMAGVVATGWSHGLGPVFTALSSGGLLELGQNLGDWYVGPSRIIPNTINEFPFWSFLFADLHPHLIALPITLLAIALAYQVFTSNQQLLAASAQERFPPPVAPVLYALIMLTLGALAVTNSWDFPTYTLLVGAALFGAAWQATRQQGSLWLRLGRAVLLTGGLAVGGLALYMPFFEHFYAFVSGIGFVPDGTSGGAYIVIYGLFLAILLPVVLGAVWRLGALRRRQALHTARRATVAENSTTHGRSRWPLAGSHWLLASAVLLPLFLIIGIPMLGLRLYLGILLIVGVLLLLQRRLAPATWFTFLLTTLAWAVSLGIEIIFIRDHLAGGDAYRMNTVFKFGLQIWTLMALSAAASLPRLLRGLRRNGGTTAQITGLAAIGILTAAAAVFLLVGTPSRLANRFPQSPPGPTLDGLAFMRYATFDYDCNAYGGCEPGVDRVSINLQPDADAIAWLNQNITGTPVVLQSNLWFYRAYGVRVAANTGLPTVVSALHVNEQRDPAAASARDSDVETLFRTSDIDTTLRLLAKYHVDYIYVGSVEHAFYNATSLEKFQQMNGAYLDTVYNQPGVQIYKVRDIPQFYAAPATFNFADEENPAPPPPPQNNASPEDLRTLEEQVAANPTNSLLTFGLAERYRSLNRLDDAAQILQVAAQANPNDTGLHHLWGDILSQAGRYQEAEKAYMQAARANPTAGNWNKLGAALLEWGDLDKAEIALDQAVTIDASEPEPHYRLGQLYQQRGSTAPAIQALETYLQLAPDGQFSADARQLVEELKRGT